MDCGACTDHLNECQIPSCKSLGKSDEVMEANKEVVEPPTVAEGAASLGPNTPVANREIGDLPYDCSSPLTVVKKLPKVPCFESHNKIIEDPFAPVDHSSPRTPKSGVFDPFAPGPDDMAMAPFCKKYIAEMRTSVARCLKFNTSIKFGLHDDADSISDEEMLKSVYENLLEAIIAMQTESFLSEISNINWDSDDCKTPPLATCLSGVADTCPGAPVKPAGKSRTTDSGLCRKLDF